MEWMAECHHDGQKPTTTCLFIVEQHSLMHKGVSVYIWLCGIMTCPACIRSPAWRQVPLLILAG